jgi:hypothetical protein
MNASATSERLNDKIVMRLQSGLSGSFEGRKPARGAADGRKLREIDVIPVAKDVRTAIAVTVRTQFPHSAHGEWRNAHARLADMLYKGLQSIV